MTRDTEELKGEGMKSKKEYRSDFIDCLILVIIFLAIGIAFLFDTNRVEGISMFVFNALLSLLCLYFGIDDYKRMKQ